MTRDAVISSLSGKIDETLGVLLPQGSQCALLDFPTGSNPGDAAIWLGTRACLRRIGARLVYASDAASYSRKDLAARLGAGTILWGVVRMIARQITRHPTGPTQAWRYMVHIYDLLARQWLVRCCRTLSRGRIVITDRLHGHILSSLLGVPHIVLDNNYGKVSGFYEQWTRECGLATWANSPTEALELAAFIAQGMQ